MIGPPAPVTPPRHWREQLTIEGQQIERMLLNNLDLYAEVLGTEMVVAAEDLLAGLFFGTVRSGAISVAADRSTGHVRPIDLPFGGQLAESVEAREVMTAQFRAVFAAYERLAGREIVVPDVLWRDDVSPGWSSSRYLGDIAQARPTEISTRLPRGRLTGDAPGSNPSLPGSANVGSAVAPAASIDDQPGHSTRPLPTRHPTPPRPGCRDGRPGNGWTVTRPTRSRCASSWRTPIRFVDERLPPLAEVALAASALAELRHGHRRVGVEVLRRVLHRG
jgi:hypothetical protein